VCARFFNFQKQKGTESPRAPQSLNCGALSSDPFWRHNFKTTTAPSLSLASIFHNQKHCSAPPFSTNQEDPNVSAQKVYKKSRKTNKPKVVIPLIA